MVVSVHQSLQNQFIFNISRITEFIVILNMIIIMGQCITLNPEVFANNDFNYKPSSIVYENSPDNYPFQSLPDEKNIYPTNNDKYFSLSSLNTYSTYKNEFPVQESLPQRIRKRDDGDESPDNEEDSPASQNNDEDETHSQNQESPPAMADEGKESLPDREESSLDHKESPPGNDESQPGKGESPPEKGESPPGNGESSPNKGASSFGRGESPPDNGASSLGRGESPPESGASSFGRGESPPESGASSLGRGESPPESGTSSFGRGESPPDSGASSFGRGESQSDSGASSFGRGESPPGLGELPPEREDSLSLSTSNLEEPRINYQENKPAPVENFAFQKKNPISYFSLSKPKSGDDDSPEETGHHPANYGESNPDEFMSENNWDEESFYPPTFPSVWNGQRPKTVKPPQPMVSWNEFLVMQDKFQKNKLNPNLFQENKLNPSLPKSKDNLFRLVEDALKRNKQNEKELMELKKTLEESNFEQKSSPELSGFPRIINNTLQLNVPLLQQGKVTPQEFKIKIEAEAPLKIRTQVGDGKDDTIRINDKPLRLAQRSSEDLNSTSTNEIQVREISTNTTQPAMITISTEPVRDSSSTITVSTAKINTEMEEYDPLKLERAEFIRKGAEFLRQAWYKYKQKRHPFLQ